MSVGPAFARTARHFFPGLNAWLDGVPEPRCPERITYHRRFLLWYGLLLFVGKLGSRRQLDFKYREAGTCVLDNLNQLAQTEQDTLPCNDTLDDYLAGLTTASVAAVRAGVDGNPDSLCPLKNPASPSPSPNSATLLPAQL